MTIYAGMTGWIGINQKKILEKYAREHGYSNFKFYVDDTAILGLKSELQ